MYDYVLMLLDGVDLDRFDFLPAMIISFIIVLCLGCFFRVFLTLFNVFMGR